MGADGSPAGTGPARVHVVAVTLVAVGICGLVWFAVLIWPPLGLLVASVVCVTAGLFVDWEKLRGKPARPDPRRN